MRRLIVCSITAVTVLTAWIIGAGSALAYPPTPPSASTAQTELNALTVKAEGATSGYSRDLFPHWHIVSGTCDTREEVHEPRSRADRCQSVSAAASTASRRPS
jgi:hypothetical protein